MFGLSKPTVQRHLQQYPSNRAPPPLVAAECDTSGKHVAAAATTRHPAADSDGQLPLDVGEAVEYVAV
eukprot:3732044-Prymnesium_polylepis.1